MLLLTRSSQIKEQTLDCCSVMNITNYIFTVLIFSPSRQRLIKAYVSLLCDGNANHYGELPTGLFISFQACLGCWCRDVLKILQGKVVAWLSSTILSEHWGLRASDTSVMNRTVSARKLIWAPLHCIPVSFCCAWTGFLSWKWVLASDRNLFHKALCHNRLPSLLTVCPGNKRYCFQSPC